MAQKNISPEEIRREFIIDYAMKSFRSGELLEWLSSRNYDEAAATIRSLDRNDPDAELKVCEVFGLDGVSTPRGEIAEAKTNVTNLTGMHARTAGIFAQKAQSFASKIEIRANGKSGDAKNVLSLLSMGIIYNTEVELVAEGEDAAQAVKELKELIDSGFGEEYYD